MGYDVFLSVMCPVNTSAYSKDTGNYQPVNIVPAIQSYREKLEKEDNYSDHCKYFLFSLEHGHCIFLGTKGDGLCWGAEFNGIKADQFLDDMIGFFLELWKINFVPAYHGIVITSNGEDEAETDIRMLCLANDAQSRLRYGELIVLEDIIVTKFCEPWFVKFPKY